MGTLQSLYTGDNVDCVVNGVATKPVYLRRGLRQGCSLSPMLFALYIADIGDDINASGMGFHLGSICISGLLFADDIVLVARSAQGLLHLLEIVKSNCDLLKLKISEIKSQVVSPDEMDWKLFKDGFEVLSLVQVAQYKYLGTWTFGSMWKTSLGKQEKCIQTANKYRGSCFHASRHGPDVVDIILCTWANIAVPAILFGCEMIPFSDETITAIERIQAGVAKFALGLPCGAPNICAQSELGFKPFRQVLYEKQLAFFRRVFFLDDSRWVKIALVEHLTGAWHSPYLANICAIRSKLGIFGVPPSDKLLKMDISDWFLADMNKVIISLNLPSLHTVDYLCRAPYVCEHKNASTLAKFKLGVADLGNREPRIGHQREIFCPVCPNQTPNCELHLVCECPSVSAMRSETGITSFLNHCLLQGVSLQEAYSFFINGQNCYGVTIPSTAVLERGSSLLALRDCWLARW